MHNIEYVYTHMYIYIYIHIYIYIYRERGILTYRRDCCLHALVKIFSGTHKKSNVRSKQTQKRAEARACAEAVRHLGSERGLQDPRGLRHRGGQPRPQPARRAHRPPLPGLALPARRRGGPRAPVAEAPRRAHRLGRLPRGALAQGPVPTVPGAQKFGPLRARAVGKDPGQPRSHLPGLPATEQGRQGAAEAELQRPDRRAEEHRVQQLQGDQNRGGLPASPAGAEERRQEAPVLGLPPRPERAYLHRLPDPKACGGVRAQHVHDARQRPGLPGMPARNPRQSQTPPRRMVLLQGMPAKLPRRSRRQRQLAELPQLLHALNPASGLADLHQPEMQEALPGHAKGTVPGLRTSSTTGDALEKEAAVRGAPQS